jgi:glycosyltransferase involved in cell wall biosynthesis
VRVLLAGTGIQPIPPTGFGGVERTIAEYAAALRLAGHDPVVLNHVRSRRSLDEYWFAMELKGLLRNASFDVLHASTPVVANRLAGLREPFVYTSHSRHWFERGHLGAHWGYFLERRAVSRSVATIALTDRGRSAMMAAVRRPPEELVTIPIGVDVDRFRPDPSHREGRVALGVGILAPLKGWTEAAEALKGTGVTLRLVGPPVDASYAAQLRAFGPSVELLGEVDDATLRQEFARADFLMHPSRVEFLSGVVLQALASGLPVLGGAAVGGLAEEGVSGWTTPETAALPERIAFFRAKATLLLTDPELRRRMSEAARARAEGTFSWASVVRRHVELYERLRDASRLTRPRTPGS